MDGLDTNQVRAQLFLNMANGPDQLRQRMMFALSQTIVVSANKTGSGAELIPWVRLLSRNAFGNYRTLLGQVTLSPTMGKYLDLAYSKKASATTSPNENYARELLQLFTIGVWELNQDGSLKRNAQNQPIPTYTQQTIKEFARALTGWTFPTQPGNTPSNSNPPYFVGWMEPRTTTHDGAMGVSAPSNPVTLSFPGTGTCAGAPQTPTNLAANRNGNVVTLTWQPATGEPATSFVVNVSGAFTGSFQSTTSTLTGVAGPGTYIVTVQAMNGCGSSAPTSAITVVVP